MTAKQYLKQYQAAKRKIERLRWDIEELQTLAEGGTRRLDGMPHGSGISNPLEHFIVKKVDKQKELQEQIEYAEDLLMEIEQTIDAVDNPELSALLHYRYIEGLPWYGDKYYINKSKSPYIVDKLGYTKSHVFYLHNQALNEVQNILEN